MTNVFYFIQKDIQFFKMFFPSFPYFPDAKSQMKLEQL